MFVQVACKQFMVMVIFDKATTLGLVKLYVGQAIELITPVLMEILARENAPVKGVFELQDDADLFQAATD